jgi:hypothetical protein
MGDEKVKVKHKTEKMSVVIPASGFAFSFAGFKQFVTVKCLRIFNVKLQRKAQCKDAKALRPEGNSTKYFQKI